MERILWTIFFLFYILQSTSSQNRPLPVGSLFTTQSPIPLPRELVTCPSFESRYENDNLVVAIVPGKCDMVVGVQDMTHLFPGFQAAARPPSMQSSMYGRIVLPYVFFRQPVNATVSGMDCPMYPLKYLGPRVVIDTRPGQCQIVIGIRTFPVLPSNMPNNTRPFPFPVRARYVTRAVFERTFGLL